MAFAEVYGNQKWYYIVEKGLDTPHDVEQGLDHVT